MHDTTKYYAEISLVLTAQKWGNEDDQYSPIGRVSELTSMIMQTLTNLCIRRFAMKEIMRGFFPIGRNHIALSQNERIYHVQVSRWSIGLMDWIFGSQLTIQQGPQVTA